MKHALKRPVVAGLLAGLVAGFSACSNLKPPAARPADAESDAVHAMLAADPVLVFADLRRYANSPTVRTRSSALFAWAYHLSHRGHALGLKERCEIADIALRSLKSDAPFELQAGLTVFARMGEWKIPETRCRALLKHENREVRSLALWVLCLSGKHDLAPDLMSAVLEGGSSLPQENKTSVPGMYLAAAVEAWVRRCDDEKTVLSVVTQVVENEKLPEQFRVEAFKQPPNSARAARSALRRRYERRAGWRAMRPRRGPNRAGQRRRACGYSPAFASAAERARRMNSLDTISALSREFGTPVYVKAGGGNTSAKDATTLWIKPSGTTLKDLTPEKFVALDRAKLGELYRTAPPQDAARREALVLEITTAAVSPSTPGRPSVESPLHDSFAATYVVHTHPAWVNGLACGRDGAAACLRLFPDALWVEYIDPGYTLCMEVRRRIEAYAAAHGRQPALLVLKNHGLFVAGDSDAEIRVQYRRVMDALGAHYRAAGVATELAVGPAPDAAEAARVHAALAAAGGADCAHVAASGPFPAVLDALTPDHIVYAKSYPFTGLLEPAALRAFRARHGYWPRVVVTERGVFGAGSSEKQAALALELAQDAALVAQLAQAFGGAQFMSDAARRFIENWEVESYRQKMMSR